MKSKKTLQQWTLVADADVRQVWQCANTDCEENTDGVEECFTPSPTVQDGPGNDTPYCPECGGLMKYLRTEVQASK